MSSGPMYFHGNFTRIGFGREVRTEERIKLKNNRFMAAISLCAVNENGEPIDADGKPTGKTFADYFAELAKENGYVKEPTR